MKWTNVIPYIVAMFFPIVYFVVLTNNSNEKNPGAVWALCVVLFAGAGLIASKGFIWKGRLKWIACSVLIGLAEAALLIYAV